MQEIFHQLFPIFSEKELKEQMIQHSQLVDFQVDELLLRPGQYIKQSVAFGD
jgi:hypothetical protein